jgi:hypothetical protein
MRRVPRKASRAVARETPKNKKPAEAGFLQQH